MSLLKNRLSLDKKTMHYIKYLVVSGFVKDLNNISNGHMIKKNIDLDNNLSLKIESKVPNNHNLAYDYVLYNWNILYVRLFLHDIEILEALFTMQTPREIDLNNKEIKQDYLLSLMYRAGYMESILKKKRLNVFEDVNSITKRTIELKAINHSKKILDNKENQYNLKKMNIHR